MSEIAGIVALVVCILSVFMGVGFLFLLVTGAIEIDVSINRRDYPSTEVEEDDYD